MILMRYTTAEINVVLHHYGEFLDGVYYVTTHDNKRDAYNQEREKQFNNRKNAEHAFRKAKDRMIRVVEFRNAK
jgi:hypothetical protein